MKRDRANSTTDAEGSEDDSRTDSVIDSRATEGRSAASPELLRETNEKLVIATLRTQALLEAAEAFRLLVESVEDYAIFMLDSEGRVASWNVGAQRIHGYDADEIIGLPFSSFYLPESVKAGVAERDLAKAREFGRHETEGGRVRKDGSNFWATVIVASLRDEAGRHLGFATATRDMTERLRAEQERVRLTRIEESERRKDEFLAIMGHELRNPLAPMVTAMQLVKLRGGRNCEKEFAVLDRQIHHMMHLVDDLINLSRTLRGQLDLNPTVVEMGQILADAIEVALPLIEKKRHRLKVDAATEGLLVEVDPERITQVFVNLLNNAAKYMDPGGEIAVSASAESGRVEVTIADMGVGIAPDLMPRIFELFTQGEQGLERRFGGLGIGLAIARRLIDAHRGEISVQSGGPGRGSCFTVRLTQVDAAVASPPSPSTVRPGAMAKRVLIVDDNEDATEMMSALVRRFGHETRVAFEGVHALELAHEFRPNIVFLDIGLPGLSGFEVARRLRQIPECADIPIVAVTGYTRTSDRDQAFRSGFSEHFAKPIDPKLVQRAVDTAPNDK